MSITLSIVIAVLTIQAATPPKADPRREPASAIADMIRLIERRDFVALLKTYATPDQLEKFTESATLEAAAAKVADERGAGMLEALKAAAKLTPDINAEKTRARYRFPAPIAGDGSLTLVKIGEYWYLR
jgi:hypothetical protein